MRTREYLTPAEVEKLIAAAKLGRHSQRDATLILVAFRHGLRAVEIADLEWSQVEWGRNPALHAPPRSVSKTKAPVVFRCSSRSMRNSSPRMGCTAGLPFFALRT